MVEPNTGTFLFDGTIERSDDGIIWHIRPEDTNDAEIGDYYWEAQVEFSNGDA